MSKLPQLVSAPLPVIPIPIFIDSGFKDVSPIIIKSPESKPKKLVLDKVPIKNVNITTSLPARVIMSEDKVPLSQGLIHLPYNKTIISHPEVLPLKINTDPSVLALAYNPKQTILDVLDEIDENKLLSVRSSGTGSAVYTLDELKKIARKLGLKTSASKDKLIADIKEIINDRRSQGISKKV
jgi:hypothetical protein